MRTGEGIILAIIRVVVSIGVPIGISKCNWKRSDRSDGESTDITSLRRCLEHRLQSSSPGHKGAVPHHLGDDDDDEDDDNDGGNKSPKK